MSAVAFPARPNYADADYGLRSWLLSTDHKRIAILYMLSITLLFVVGGLAATLMRVELLTPGVWGLPSGW